MAKLEIIYRIKDDERDYFKGQTYRIISFESKIATISIAPNETRRLKELVDGITKDLKSRTYFNEDEEIEIDNFEREIMQYEVNYNKRVGNNVHNILKLLYPQLESGEINTIEEAMTYIEEVTANA